jgi:hypothetical protein
MLSGSAIAVLNLSFERTPCCGSVCAHAPRRWPRRSEEFSRGVGCGALLFGADVPLLILRDVACHDIAPARVCACRQSCCRAPVEVSVTPVSYTLLPPSLLHYIYKCKVLRVTPRWGKTTVKILYLIKRFPGWLYDNSNHSSDQFVAPNSGA